MTSPAGLHRDRRSAQRYYGDCLLSRRSSGHRGFSAQGNTLLRCPPCGRCRFDFCVLRTPGYRADCGRSDPGLPRFTVGTGAHRNHRPGCETDRDAAGTCIPGVFALVAVVLAGDRGSELRGCHSCEPRPNRARTSDYRSRVAGTRCDAHPRRGTEIPHVCRPWALCRGDTALLRVLRPHRTPCGVHPINSLPIRRVWSPTSFGLWAPTIRLCSQIRSG